MTKRSVHSKDLSTELAPEGSQQAHAVIEIVEENMAAAARSHAAEWGRDLTDRCLFAFGGAAPLHAVGLAQKLKMRRVIIPRGAGVGSAIGFLLAPVRFEVVRSVVSDLSALDRDALEKLFDEMHAEASAVLTSARAPAPWQESLQAYMRYAGQGYEIAVPAERTLDGLLEAFEVAYEQLYGRIIPGMPVEILSWTLALSSPAEAGHGKQMQQTKLTQVGEQFYFDGEREHTLPIWARPEGSFTEVIQGPALVVEAQTTIVIPPGWHGRCIDGGALELQREAADE